MVIWDLTCDILPCAGSGGSDWRKIEVMRVNEATGEGKKLDDVLEFVKFSSITWTHDNKVPPLVSAQSAWQPPMHQQWSAICHALKLMEGPHSHMLRRSRGAALSCQYNPHPS